MATKPIYEPTYDPQGWFDVTLETPGWFDDDLADVAAAGGTDALTALNLTVSSPALGNPNVVNTVPAPLTVSSPVLGTPNLINTKATNLTVSSPVLGTAALAITSTLTAPNFAVSALALGAPNLVNTKATNLAVSSPALGNPALGQTHVLPAPNLTVSALAIGTPALSIVVTLAAPGFAVGSAVFGLANVVSPVAAPLAVSSPVLGAPVFFVNAVLFIGDRALDFGLDVFDTECDRIYICSQQPKTFAEVSTYGLGYKHFGVGNAFGPEAVAVPNGRKVTSTQIVDGTITTNGAVSCWAAVDTANSRFLASGPLSGGKAVSSGQSFTLDAIPIHLASG